MKKILEGVKNVIAPAPETLWERGDATMRLVEIDPGRYEEVPFYDIEIAHHGQEHEEPMLDENEQDIGKKITQTIVTSDGIDRATRVFLPHDRQNDFIVQLTTPWLTSIDGHNSEGVAETISRELGVAVVLIGAEHSARKHRFPLDIMRLGHTIVQSHGISLAKTAQSCQLITADLCKRHGLSRNIVKTGESRGGMEADGEYVYADLYGNKIVYQDTTAKCLPDRVFSEGSETDKLIHFPGSELVGVAYVTAKVVKERAAKKYLGTLMYQPKFLVELDCWNRATTSKR